MIAGAAAQTSEVTHVTNVTYVTTLPCSGNEIILNGVGYYQCGTTWYSRAYQSGNVVYMACPPPAGY